jgi:hypothetical protein
VGAALGELEPRAEHKLAHSTGHQHLAWVRVRADPCTNVDRDSCNVVASPLALTRVNACAQLDPERPDSVADRSRATDGLRWTFKHGEEPVAQRLDSSPSVVLEVGPGDLVMMLDKGSPALVAELRRALGRSDDVGEQDCRKSPVGFRSVARAGQNSSISSTIGSQAPIQVKWSMPGKTASFAPSISRAR